MALYEDIKAMVRDPDGGTSSLFKITQGTREGCILNPLLFIIFFSDAVEAMENVQLDDGSFMLGSLFLSIILFADDVVLLARSIKDLQRLLDAWGRFCDIKHEQVAVNKTEALFFSKPSRQRHFYIDDGRLFQRGSDRAVTELKLLYKDEVVQWSSFFKYLGSMLSSSTGTNFLEGIFHLEDSVVTSAGKASGAVRSACRSALALPISRAVSLHSALVTPLATLNCIAWFPLVQQGGPWLSKMNDQWFWLLGLEPRPSKDYVLLAWLDFNTWEITASKMVFKFLVQMLRAPPETFLAELLVELKSDSRVNQHAWLFGALKIISKGLSFPRRDCLLERVESMLDRLRVEPTALLFKIFTENVTQSMYRTAREKLAARPNGPYRKLRNLKCWAAQDGDLPPRFSMSSLHYSVQFFRNLVLLMLGRMKKLPVRRPPNNEYEI